MRLCVCVFVCVCACATADTQFLNRHGAALPSAAAGAGGRSESASLQRARKSIMVGKKVFDEVSVCMHVHACLRRAYLHSCERVPSC
jgi:hypothetical protein